MARPSQQSSTSAQVNNMKKIIIGTLVLGFIITISIMFPIYIMILIGLIIFFIGTYIVGDMIMDMLKNNGY
jgi:hypothetical protein